MNYLTTYSHKRGLPFDKEKEAFSCFQRVKGRTPSEYPKNMWEWIRMSESNIILQHDPTYI
jgi:hypothetical protein